MVDGTPIGDKLYIFKSTQNTTDCLISAHGGYYKENRDFPVPTGATLLFYGEHKKVLADPGLKMMHQVKGLEVVDTYGAGGIADCPDYILSKYQGSHNNNNETYKSILAEIGIEDTNFEKVSARGTAGAAQLKWVGAMSVLTIRNRFLRADVNLSYVIKMALEAMPTLTTFHCSFCRGMIGDDDAETAKVRWAAMD